MDDENYYIIRKRYDGMRTRLRKQNGYKSIELPFSLEEFIKWYNLQEKKCVYCDISEKELKKGKIKPFLKNRKYWGLSIDKKDPKKEYSLDNIVLACMICNTVKNNILTFEEMKEIGEKYVKPKLL